MFTYGLDRAEGLAWLGWFCGEAKSAGLSSTQAKPLLTLGPEDGNSGAHEARGS